MGRNPLLIGSTVLTLTGDYNEFLTDTGRNPLLIGSTVLTKITMKTIEIVNNVAIPS